MTIPEMQEAILKAGWQYNELIFNDGCKLNCYIQFSQSTNPHALGVYPTNNEELQKVRGKNVGWGRFERHHAWSMAYDYIINGVRNEYISV